MNESAKFEAQKKKLQGLCDEHHLVYSLEKNSYPITLTLRPTGEVGGQLSLPEVNEDDSFRSPDASLVLSIEDGDLDIKTSETFTISATLLDKLKGIFNKMHFFWLQFFFREITEQQLLTANQMPMIEDSDAESPNEKDEDTAPDVVTTVDGSGLVTSIQFPGNNDEGDDAELPEDEDGGPSDDYCYDDPADGED